MSSGEWLSVEQVADACGMSYRTMLRMVRRGEVPAEKPYRIRRAGADV